MNRFFRKCPAPLALALTVSLLAGCADSDDGRNTQAQGTAAGAVLGGAVGAALGYAIGGGEGAARGAVAGAAVGAVEGFAYGSHVAAKKEAYRDSEDWLDACLVSAREYRQHTYAYNRTLKTRIAALESRRRSAVAAHDRAALGRIHQEAGDLRRQSASEYRVAEEEVASQRNALRDGSLRNSPKAGELRGEVDGLNQNKAQLGQNMSRLASLENETNI